MLTGLYYPNIAIENVGLMKRALLLYDRLEYISPFGKFPINWKDATYKTAADIITAPHIPSKIEKEAAHKIILELVASPLPDWFFAVPSDEYQQYQIYPQKFLPETWEALQELRAIQEINGNYLMSASLGLSLMAILADSCAGSQRQLVTDKLDMYAALTKYITKLNGGDCSMDNRECDRLVTISVKTLHTEPIPLEKLVELRTKEINDSTGHLRKLRHNYVNTINKYVEKIASEVRTANDQREIERQFEQAMADDLGGLFEELKMNAWDAVFSREMAAAIVCAAGSSIEPLSAASIATGALINKKVKYRAARKQIEKNHPMAWLHASSGFQFL